MNVFRLVIVLLLSGTLEYAAAQSLVNFNNGLGTGVWVDGAGGMHGNWDSGFVPSSSFSEAAVIGSTALNPATATVNTVVTITPGGIILGNGSGNVGTLNITAGGSVTAVAGGLATGSLVVSNGGTGTLNMTGGSLSVVSIDQNAGGSINLSGNASLVATSASTLGGTTKLTGNAVNFDIGAGVTFEGTHTLIAEINAATVSRIEANGIAALAGTLNVNFQPGFSGTSWNLIDATNILGSFSAINVTGGPTLSNGQVYGVRTVNGGTYGKQAQLYLDQLLRLTVNRATGELSIANPGASTAVAIDAYTVFSPGDALNEAAWNSLEGRISDWTESNPTANRLSELKPTGSTSVTAGQTITLGNVFAPAAPTAFGTSSEDLQFQYRRSDGQTVTAEVEYLGYQGINNLTLIVDPTTGQAQLRNTSTFTVDIDAYAVRSQSGSLNVAGWSSLDDQNAAGGDWRESQPLNTQLAELKPAGTLTLAPNAFHNLGALFTPSAARDLALTFRRITGDAAGDFNGDGTVDTADYTVWRDGLGATFTAADYDVWRANFGSSATSSTATTMTGVVVYGSLPGSLNVGGAVPEPGTLMLSVGLIGIVLGYRQRA